MYRILITFIPVCLLLFSKSVLALQIFACEPEWASLANELSGELNQIKTALTVRQDPHRLQAKPSLISTIRKADLLICSGADLEIGWLPLLLRRSGNRQIQPGQPGYFEASSFVKRLEIPTQIDRSQGDLHPQGNPHVHLDPRNIRIISKALTQRLIDLDPDHAIEYQAMQDEFHSRWKDSMRRWKTQAESLRGAKVVTHHTSFSYLLNAFGINRVGTLESKPGIPPGSAHLSSLLKVVEDQHPDYLIRTPYEDPHPSEWLAGKTGLTMIELPYSVNEDGPAKNLFELFDVTLNLLLEKYEH
jgi:zinc/manganese transport system substrate-binding protein